MGLTNKFVGFSKTPYNVVRLLLVKIVQIVHIFFDKITCHTCFRNTIVRKPHSRIAQPKYYNNWSDFQDGLSAGKLFYINDVAKRFDNDEVFDQAYRNQRYDSIIKAYYPTKNTGFQSINIKLSWDNSYWNPKNRGNEQKYKISDLHFADMMVNTQGIYKLKKIQNDSQMKEKVVKFFSAILEKNKEKFHEGKKGKNIIDALIESDNLFCLDYPVMRQVEQNVDLIGENGRKYQRILKTTSETPIPVYCEVPFAIFAKIPDYAGLNEKREDLVCVAAVFNDTYYKNKDDEVFDDEIYHCFVENPVGRDRWEMAKIHMSSTDVNDFTVRTHLGMLHFASSIYTTAFYNLAVTKPSLKWLYDEFVNVFSWGLLQVNFVGNITLLGHDSPLMERVTYLNYAKSGHIITQENSKFNLMEFDPEHLGKDSYESEAVTMSKAHYDKLRLYIEYLFEKYEETWTGKTREMGEFIISQLRDEEGKFDAIPESVALDDTPESLKRIMTNLAYIWVVHHAETFAFTSVCCNFYQIPSTVRKPLSELPSHELSEEEKREWMLHPESIKDYLTLQKVVTYKEDQFSLLSCWNDLQIDDAVWSRVLKKTGASDSEESFLDLWNEITKKHQKMNLTRSQQGLYFLHWLLPHQMPISLYI